MFAEQNLLRELKFQNNNFILKWDEWKNIFLDKRTKSVLYRVRSFSVFHRVRHYILVKSLDLYLLVVFFLF